MDSSDSRNISLSRLGWGRAADIIGSNSDASSGSDLAEVLTDEAPIDEAPTGRSSGFIIAATNPREDPLTEIVIVCAVTSDMKTNPFV